MSFALDHVALVVPDLDAAAASYRRLGFRLTAKSSHKGALPSGEIGPWGTGNYCAMFEQGYFEILGITDRKAAARAMSRAGSPAMPVSI